jgi:hypothetical protein
VPFALIEIDGERSLQRFLGDLEDAQQQALDAVRTASGFTRAAVAWDSYLTADRERSDAVLVEASEAGEPESVVVAQRYVVTGRIRKKLEVRGNAALAARGNPLF